MRHAAIATGALKSLVLIPFILFPGLNSAASLQLWGTISLMLNTPLKNLLVVDVVDLSHPAKLLCCDCDDWVNRVPEDGCLLPLYGFLLFSLLIVFLLQKCPVPFIPCVVQVLCHQAVVGSQPVLLNILEKTKSFLLFGAHHSSSFSTAFWKKSKHEKVSDTHLLPLQLQSDANRVLCVSGVIVACWYSPMTVLPRLHSSRSILCVVEKIKLHCISSIETEQNVAVCFLAVMSNLFLVLLVVVKENIAHFI